MTVVVLAKLPYFYLGKSAIAIDQRAHRPGERGAGAAARRGAGGRALLRAGQVDGAARLPAPGAGQQDGLAPGAPRADPRAAPRAAARAWLSVRRRLPDT